MDPRRLSTSEFLQSGLMYRPGPGTLVPEGMNLHDLYLDDKAFEDEVTLEYIKELLGAGDGIKSAQDYGCWAIWKVDNGYDGELVQYRRRTAELHGLSLDDAADQAWAWWQSL